jgi:hypothetical protein
MPLFHIKKLGRAVKAPDTFPRYFTRIIKLSLGSFEALAFIIVKYRRATFVDIMVMYLS